MVGYLNIQLISEGSIPCLVISSSLNGIPRLLTKFVCRKTLNRNKCNDWSRTSNESSKSTSPCTSPTTYPVEWDKKLDSPNGKQEKCNHPRHPLPLPLPPNSSINNRTRQWKKGKLLAKGTFGNVYAGFNRYVMSHDFHSSYFTSLLSCFMFFKVVDSID